ncbi:unnamed protein product [Plutella xylostella]|uniref:(diamondback moth) hypothetical protein n=1 Tax=Plutella xylostella TaxID=51655 RepID=A0A8S4FE94_PLUXY|nr:unnamed protein product [Plutella xylostella]
MTARCVEVEGAFRRSVCVRVRNWRCAGAAGGGRSRPRAGRGRRGAGRAAVLRQRQCRPHVSPRQSQQSVSRRECSSPSGAQCSVQCPRAASDPQHAPRPPAAAAPLIRHDRPGEPPHQLLHHQHQQFDHRSRSKMTH